MTYDINILTLPIEDRKIALDKLIVEMIDYYKLSKNELLEYKLWLFAPEDLQVDLCIHFLGVYKTVLDTELINKVLCNNSILVDTYKSGNTKILNSILGKILAADKHIDPKECMSYLKEVL